MQRQTTNAAPLGPIRAIDHSLVTEQDSSLKGLRNTGRECHVCEIGVFLKDDSELICNHCQYSPDPSAPSTSEHNHDPWESFRRSRRRAAEDGERPYCVGGFKNAYWGSGEYEYSPRDGFRGPE